MGLKSKTTASHLQPQEIWLGLKKKNQNMITILTILQLVNSELLELIGFCPQKVRKKRLNKMKKYLKAYTVFNRDPIFIIMI